MIRVNFSCQYDSTRAQTYLLLGAELVGMTALSLATVGGTRRKTGIALAANVLLAVVLGSQSLQRGLNDTTTETEHQVESRFLLNVVVRKGAAILELLSSENQTLLVWGNAFLVLDLLLDILNGVRAISIISLVFPWSCLHFRFRCL